MAGREFRNDFTMFPAGFSTTSLRDAIVTDTQEGTQVPSVPRGWQIELVRNPGFSAAC